MAKVNQKKASSQSSKLSCFCKTDIFKRVLTSVILIPLVLALLFVGSSYMGLAVFVLGSMLAYEWVGMVKNNNSVFYAIVYTGVMAMGALVGDPLLFGISLLFSLFLIYFKAKEEKHKKLLMLGLIYVSVGVSSILWVYNMDKFAMVFMLFVIWATDIGGYIVGPRIKGPKIAPKISPNKRWSGAVGGILGACLVALVFVNLFDATDLTLDFVIFATAVSLLGQVGDFIESAIKRNLGIKDSSQLIPGHGGLFDRLDSILFAAPMVWLFYVVMFFVTVIF